MKETIIYNSITSKHPIPLLVHIFLYFSLCILNITLGWSKVSFEFFQDVMEKPERNFLANLII